MNQKTENYNLLVEEWIPILRTNGKFERVGIWTALTEAGRIRQIAASNPMDNVALLRLLLAVLQWCAPEATEDELEELRCEDTVGIPSHLLEDKLGMPEQPNSAFDLLGTTSGFYQDHTAGGVKVAVTNLLHDFPSGSKIAHFRHTRDHREGMCLACCALGLVRWPGVASAGTAGAGQSMTASINGNTPAYSVRISATLLATLMFTWPCDHAVDGDAPVWASANEESPLGFFKGMTWRSRRVLLAFRDTEGEREVPPQCCCLCGQHTNRLIRSIHFRPGWQRFSKEPWSEDPHLLRITRRTGKSFKKNKIVPSWPSPNDRLEDHAAVWRSVLEGHLQRSAASETEATELHTTLLANSQALYKHVGLHTASLPRISPDLAHRLLNEMEWLKQLTWITTSTRSGNWREPPKGHFVVEALCAPGAKGHAIRSGLCARSPLTESGLEKAFLKLAHGLAVLRQADRNATEQAVDDWRSEVRRILRNHIDPVIYTTTPGSPLRQQEATRHADDAVGGAVRQVERQRTKVVDKPEGGRRKGNKA